MNAIPTCPLTPCREWQAGRQSGGYGQKWLPGRRPVLVHRWVMEQVHGPLSSSTTVMHLCDNRRCFRFDHLHLGTIADNNADMRAKGRGHKPPRHFGLASTSALLDADQVRQIRNLIETTTVSLTAIGAEFGVRRWVVADIRDNRTYQDVA